jgi:hypothetical protein
MENGLSLADTLRRVSLERLFRVGASLEGRKPPPTPEPEEDDGPNPFDPAEGGET